MSNTEHVPLTPLCDIRLPYSAVPTLATISIPNFISSASQASVFYVFLILCRLDLYSILLREQGRILGVMAPLLRPNDTLFCVTTRQLTFQGLKASFVAFFFFFAGSWTLLFSACGSYSGKSSGSSFFLSSSSSSTFSSLQSSLLLLLSWSSRLVLVLLVRFGVVVLTRRAVDIPPHAFLCEKTGMSHRSSDTRPPQFLSSNQPRPIV
jgi:hypothetical protein